MDQMQQWAASLSAEADRADAEAMETRTKLRAIEDRARRLRKAATALVDEPQAKPKPKAEPKGKRGRRPFIPAEQTVDMVFRALLAECERHNGGGVTMREVAGRVPVSTTTVQAALQVLREREQVRLAGVNERKAQVYRPLVEASA